jgi:glutamate-1-semialdehyde 2,1-aminomutase
LTAGIHLRGGDKGGFLSTAHTDADLDVIHDAFLLGFQSLAGFGLLPLTDGTNTP